MSNINPIITSILELCGIKHVNYMTEININITPKIFEVEITHNTRKDGNYVIIDNSIATETHKYELNPTV